MKKGPSLSDLVTRNEKINSSDQKINTPLVSFVKKEVPIPEYPCLIVFDKLNNKGKNNATIELRSLSPVLFPKDFPLPSCKRGEVFLFTLTQKEALSIDGFKAFGYKKNNIQDLVSKISNRIFVVYCFCQGNNRKIGEILDSHLRSKERKDRVEENTDSHPFSLVPRLKSKEEERLKEKSCFNLENYPLDFFPLPEFVLGSDVLYKISSYTSSSRNGRTTHFVREKARVYKREKKEWRITYLDFAFLPLNKRIGKDTPCLYALPREREENRKEDRKTTVSSLPFVDESIIKKTYDKYPNEKRPIDYHVRSVVSGLSKVINACHKKNLEQRQLRITHIRDELRLVFYVIVKELAPEERTRKYFRNSSSRTKRWGGRKDFGEYFLKSRDRNKAIPGGTFYLSETRFFFDAFSHLFNDEYNSHNVAKIEAFFNRSPADKDRLLYSFIYFFYNLNLTTEEKERLDKALSVKDRLTALKEQNG